MICLCKYTYKQFVRSDYDSNDDEIPTIYCRVRAAWSHEAYKSDELTVMSSGYHHGGLLSGTDLHV